jgi:DNA-binding transcriptional MerR regulator
MVTTYTPGEAAEKVGCTLDTLRYYERIGLLEQVARTAGGQRVFSEDDIGWIGLLRCLRDTGMPIARMQQFAELVRSGHDTVEARAALLEEHDREIDARVARLRADQARIREKITYYRGVGSVV